MLRFRSITKLFHSTNSCLFQKESSIFWNGPVRKPYFRDRPCYFSSKSSLEATTSSETAVVESSPLGSIVRHGQGDGVIALNVGGKEFKTLRSTVAANSVLAEHVARAEANQELISGGNVVFIDREPAQFGIILQYLRNRVDDVSFSSSYKKEVVGVLKSNQKVYAEHYVQLPKDTKVLSDLYVEACHYKMTDLQDALCRQSFLTNAAASIGIGGRNPFDAASTFMKHARRALIAVGGFGTMIFGVQQDGGDINGGDINGGDSNGGEKGRDMRILMDSTKQQVMDAAK